MSGKEFEISKYTPPEIKQLYKMLNNDLSIKTAYKKQVEILEKLISKNTIKNQ